MHNEIGNFGANNPNEPVFSAEKFGLDNSDRNIEKKVVNDIEKGVSANVVKQPVKMELSEQSAEVLDRNSNIESARIAMENDGSSRTKEIGKEFSKLVQGVISNGIDDPARLNDEYDSLSRQAIRGMFGREIGGGK